MFLLSFFFSVWFICVWVARVFPCVTTNWKVSDFPVSLSWATRSRGLTSMGWRYSSSMSTLRFVRRLRWWKPKSWSTRLLLAPSSHSRKGRITRGRTLSTYLIGGSQTVQRCQDSRTCCVQFWRTHPIRARLSDFLASSMRLTMTIRRGLTPTTLNYRCSRSLTNDRCSSRVSR